MVVNEYLEFYWVHINWLFLIIIIYQLLPKVGPTPHAERTASPPARS